MSKWKARVLPSVLDSLEVNGKLPSCLTMSFASLCEFYARGRMTDEGFIGTRQKGTESVTYKISDDRAVIDFFAENGEKDNVLELFAAREDFWGRDLTKVKGFVEESSRMLAIIRKDGAAAAMKEATKATV